MKISPEVTKIRIGYPTLAKMALVAAAAMTFSSWDGEKQTQIGGEKQTQDDGEKQARISEIEQRIRQLDHEIMLQSIGGFVAPPTSSCFKRMKLTLEKKKLIAEWQQLTGSKYANE